MNDPYSDCDALPPNSTTTSSLPWIVFAVLIPIYGALLYFRPIDGDEGLYLTAANEVARGRLPYRDFAYFQFPTMLYVYGAWVRYVTGPSPIGVRALSLLWSAGTLLLLIFWARNARLGDRTAAILVLLCGAAGMTMAWATTIKTYPICIFLSFASFVAFSVARTSDFRRRFPLFLGGLCVGLAGSVRLFYVFCIPACLIWIVWNARRNSSLSAGFKSVGWASLGALLGSLPTIFFALSDWPSFFFHTVTKHYYRSDITDTLSQWIQKGEIVVMLLGHFNLVALVALSLEGLKRNLFNDEHSDQVLAVGLVMTLALTQILPVPTFTQYYTNLIPFLVVSAAPQVRRMVNWTGDKGRRAKAILALFIILAPIEMCLLEIRPLDIRWGPTTMKEWNQISNTIESMTQPGDRVLSWWPGVVSSARRVNQAGFENYFSFIIAPRLPQQYRQRYHFPTEADALEIIQRGEPALVILRQHWPLPDIHIFRSTVEKRYILEKQIGDFLLYRRQNG